MSAENKAFIHAKTGNVVLPKGRILWNSVFKPRKGKPDQPGKYELTLLFSKDVNLDVAKEAMTEAGKDAHPKLFREAKDGKWPSKITRPFKHTKDNDKLVAALEASDLKVEDFPVYLGAKTKDRPGIVGPNGKVVEDEEQVYSGRWARMTIDFFGGTYEKKLDYVSAGLKNIQLLDNDDELVVGGGRVSPETEFDAVEGAGDDSKSADSLFE